MGKRACKEGVSTVRGNLRQQVFLTQSREEREEKAFRGIAAPVLEEDSSATEFKPLRVLRVFA
jgi:hypothetical protein